MIYRIDNGIAGPSGLMTREAEFKANCVCMQSVLSKFLQIYYLLTYNISHIISAKMAKVSALVLPCIIMSAIIVSKAVLESKKRDQPHSSQTN